MGSISIAYRFLKPLTRVASFENFWPNASDKLWAGSVDLNRRDQRPLKMVCIVHLSQSIKQIHDKRPAVLPVNMKWLSFLNKDSISTEEALRELGRPAYTTFSTCAELELF